MKHFLSFAPALTLALMTSSVLIAGAAKDPAPPEPKYDTATVIDVNATITAQREVPKGSPMAGLHLAVKVGSEDLDVYVGPTEFVKIFEVTFKKGDSIHLIGSKVTFQEATVVLARDITLGTITLSLRDNSGEPLWKFFLKPPVG
ncbi:MAG TPA: hypothetical protein VMT15_15420 [Bryobacteraceae bacterium]|nr:hypothetical protein [Bryobacteraceae bacterium]